MALDIRTLEQIAPDQASLKAAAGLTKPAKWSGVSMSDDGTVIWGACAGSGANPYKLAVDLRDNVAKCTCPSRKFPCKHGLALLWMKADGIVAFPVAETPEWIGDWLKKRRHGAVKVGTAAGKDATAATQDDGEPADPKAIARKEAAAAKRASETDAAIIGSLDALEQWTSDQLRTGLASFVDDASARCRRIASRMIDGKAPMLAGRIDELPAKILRTPPGDRIRVVTDDLARMVLLSRAFRSSPRDPAIRRAVTSAESRETVLSDPTTLRVKSSWEVLAERVVTRRDGLISQTTWLLNLADGPRFAMLLDFNPASAGRRGSSFIPGEQFDAELAFYAASHPMRALMLAREDDRSGLPWPVPGDDGLVAETMAAQLADPWCGEIPVLLPPGRILLDDREVPWWRSECGTMLHPVVGDVPTIARGAPMRDAAAIWSANRLEMLAGNTSWGRIRFDV